MDKAKKQFILVNLDDKLYGIDIEYIHNIIVMHNITRVPKAQPYFLGVINLRGDIIPVMSLHKKLMTGSDDKFTSISRIVIVKPEPSAAPIGLIVDQVNEVISINEENIEKMNYDDKDDKAILNYGIGKYENDLINLLNIPGIVTEKVAQ